MENYRKEGIMNLTDEIVTLMEALREFDASVEKRVEPGNKVKQKLGETMLNILTLVKKQGKEEVPNVIFSMLPDYYKRVAVAAFVEAVMNLKGYSIPPSQTRQEPPQGS